MKKSIIWNVKTRPCLVSATLLICVISAISVISGLAQSPEKMSYQAVVRDASDNLVTNQSVGMQISILQGSAGGTAVYVETQTPTTNTNGLVTIEIGSGTVVTGDFTTIDWTNGPYFIKTETDPTGGTTYTITGTSQLLSVPYALHAKTAESVTGTITETDPVFGSSVANSITASDTANWNNHTIDTDTQLDSTGVAALGYVAGAHTVDTDTQLDSTGVASLGFVAGAHTIDTDTQLDSTDIANLGYVAGTISETDPVFGSSVAGGITGADTTNWNNKLDTEIDADTTNELQNLSLSNDTLYISSGTSVILTDADSTNELQNLSLAGDTLSISNGNNVILTDNVNDADADSTNELQSFSISFGDTLFISNSNFVIIPGLYAANLVCEDSVQDADGNWYDVVKIGSQCWMAENLNVGTYVPVAAGGQAPAGTQKYCQNLSGVNDPACPFGGLYEWDEMMDGSLTCNGTGAPPNDGCVTVVQGICPTGWHIPSHYEWTTLEKNVGSNPGAFPYDVTTTGLLGTDEGGSLKQTGITNWTTPNTGATNSSAFTALPGGYSWSGAFFNVGSNGYWWSATENSGTDAWGRYLNYTEARINRNYGTNKAFGFSVRCLQD